MVSIITRFDSILIVGFLWYLYSPNIRIYSRGQKKVNISFVCNERFRFVSFSFRFVSVLT